MRNSLVVLAALVLWMGRADAGRRRIVVLDFEGPKAEKFHADVVKLIKKSHTVLSVDKWNEQADELGASAVTDKNIKKVAKKLKIDGVITGKVEKRRDEYIVRLKLRSGSGGEVVGNTETKSSAARLDAQAQRDIKDELVAAIEELDSNRGGGDEGDEEESPRKKKSGEDEEEEEEAPKKSGFGKKGQMSAEEDPKALAKKKKAEEEEAKRLAKEEEKARKEEEKRKKDEDARLAKEEEKRKKEDDKRKKEQDKKAAQEAAFAKSKAKTASEDEEEETANEDEEEPRSKKKKRTAARDVDEESIEEEADDGPPGSGRDLSPAGRAVDAVVGMSFTARTLKFTYAMDLGKPPPGYKQPVPVAGGILDVTVYPLALGKTQGLLRGLGLTLLYDQVLVINSQKRYSDQQGNQRIANLSTKESRWAVGPVLRYPMGKIVLGGALTYGKQQFTIAQTLPNNEPTDIPNVEYTMFTPSVFVKYPVTSKINLNADLAFHGITNTGQIQASGMTGYGASTVTGFEVEGGGDYMVTKNIFARASVRYESIGFKFKGDPTSQTNIRDNDPEQDVTGAKDTYFGGTVTVGYVY